MNLMLYLPIGSLEAVKSRSYTLWTVTLLIPVLAAIYFNDPDGHQFELYVHLKD